MITKQILEQFVESEGFQILAPGAEVHFDAASSKEMNSSIGRGTMVRYGFATASEANEGWSFVGHMSKMTRLAHQLLIGLDYVNFDDNGEVSETQDPIGLYSKEINEEYELYRWEALEVLAGRKAWVSHIGGE